MDDPFTKLPEDFVSEILSRTSPLDASRLAVVSKGYKSAAESDAVWDKFLPSDFAQIVSTSVSPVVYSTKKELYFSLCHSPILLDAGKLYWEKVLHGRSKGAHNFLGRHLMVLGMDIISRLKPKDLMGSKFVNDEADSDAVKRAGILHLQRSNARQGSQQQTGQLPVRRNDGWMEIEMGNFYNDKGDDGEAEARLIEIKRLGGKSGLIVQGIEFRPQA
ncbi:hypothetical protein DH2020_005163 [Rehmannia glutinosa]|uniref:F-box domain-containing protein n=1 Tax=Rehmannia glutinosa TaxID=99300 RepID=A0ABR0XRI6_REHGL